MDALKNQNNGLLANAIRFAKFERIFNKLMCRNIMRAETVA